MIRKIIILDGYTDEPAGLGVPPYINVYPRLIAGTAWSISRDIIVRYWTIDEVRVDMDKFVREALSSDLIFFIAGAEVPGRYIGGKPITLEEIERICFLLKEKDKILIGPGARYGLGLGGGTLAVERKKMKMLFTEVVYGDIEIYLHDLLLHGWEKAEPWRLRENYSLADKAFIKGAKIITQHPNHGWNLVVEIETFRGCPRHITGGCSFCIEPRYGKPLMRDQKSIVAEVEALYRYGARHFRLGRQPDILVYGSKEIGEKEFPKPRPSELEKLFYGIRNNAPGLRVLHIDNVNPGTIVFNPEEAIEALKIIVKYHTPGDVAALGIESFDPKVVKQNNLKVMPDEALEAIRIINKVGRIRGWNGLPHLLPGINLLYGLPGETKETYRINLEYLKKILKENLLVRRVNIRMVTVLENTPLWIRRDSVARIISRHRMIYRSHRNRVMNELDKPMLTRIVPPGTLLRYLYTESYLDGFTVARMPGSYPILVKIHGKRELKKIVDVRIKHVSSKSVTGVVA